MPCSALPEARPSRRQSNPPIFRMCSKALLRPSAVSLPPMPKSRRRSVASIREAALHEASNRKYCFHCQTPMPNIQMLNPDGLGKPLGQYSHITRVRASEFLFIAGQVGADPDGRTPADFDAQCTL